MDFACIDPSKVYILNVSLKRNISRYLLTFQLIKYKTYVNYLKIILGGNLYYYKSLLNCYISNITARIRYYFTENHNGSTYQQQGNLNHVKPYK